MINPLREEFDTITKDYDFIKKLNTDQLIEYMRERLVSLNDKINIANKQWLDDQRSNHLS